MSKDNRQGSKAGRNSIRIIKPYKYEGVWVFDDENTGLVREPFVMGADDIIDVMCDEIENAEEGFTLFFSSRKFPGTNLQLLRVREECGGWWYRCEGLDMDGWLCPALFLYFEEAPKELYCMFRGCE